VIGEQASISCQIIKNVFSKYVKISLRETMPDYKSEAPSENVIKKMKEVCVYDEKP